MTSSIKVSSLKRSLSLALIFQIGWIVTVIIGLLFGKQLNIGLFILLLFTLWAPAALELITRTKFPTVLHVHFSILLTIASFMGSLFGVYALIPHWDSFAHWYSGLLLAWLGLFAVRAVQDKSKGKFSVPRWFSVSVAIVTPLAFAAVWEICEFTSDTYLHTHTQAGLQDTILDMVSAGVGAIIAVLILAWFDRPKSVLPHL
jgi:putative Mn2+ efflux pump MntP